MWYSSVRGVNGYKSNYISRQLPLGNVNSLYIDVFTALLNI